MKTLIICISFLCLNIQSLDLNKIRDAYKEAAHDKTKVTEYNNKLDSVTKNSNIVLVAYKGAGIALKGRYAKKIPVKKKYFIDGVSLLEYAIEKAPNNIELRFIRLGIQENTPKLLKYKSKIEEDKTFIINNFSTINSKVLRNHIKEYILQSNIFKEEEKKLI